MKHLILIALLFTAACSFNGQDETTKQYLEDREELVQKYSKIEGTYAGTLTTMQRSRTDVTKYEEKVVPLEMAIFFDNIPSGPDSNGETKLVPTLKIRYRQLDVARLDQILQARFISETGELHAANTDGSTSLRNTFVRGNEFFGEVYRNNGLLGHFRLNLASKTVLNPNTDPATDYYNRLEAQYKSIEGFYEGTVTPTNKEIAPYQVTLELIYVPVSKAGVLTATMKGNFRRTSDHATIVRVLDVSYRLEVTPAELVMAAQGVVGAPDDYYTAITAEVINDRIKGSLIENRGRGGLIELSKK